MGAWHTGVFDNDHAADFASSVEACSDTEARHDLLMATMGAVLERDIRPDEVTTYYELGSDLEAAIASAAFVADAKNGVHEFTNTSYAMGLEEDGDPTEDSHWHHIEIGEPSPALVERGVLTLEKILLAMVTAGITKEWRDPTEKVYQALLRDKG